jgi:hypothetical protein
MGRVFGQLAVFRKSIDYCLETGSQLCHFAECLDRLAIQVDHHLVRFYPGPGDRLGGTGDGAAYQQGTDKEYFHKPYF